MSITLAGGTGVLVGLGGFAAVRRLRHPSLEAYRELTQRESYTGPVRARFLGTSSILFEDGATAVLADGFVSRPSAARVFFSKISPDIPRISTLLETIKPVPLGAVFTGHSHYDHALDAPEIAARSGARLLGSRGTVERGLELGVPENKTTVIRRGQPVPVGAFELTFYESRHGPPDHAPGDAEEIVRPPARARAWKTGTTWSIFISHGTRTILVHGSAGFVPGSLPARHADVVYLGIAGFAEQSSEDAAALWREVVTRTSAKRVILVHWDDFSRPLENPLLALPLGAGSVPNAIDRVRALAGDSVEVLLPTAWTVTDPFD